MGIMSFLCKIGIHKWKDVAEPWKEKVLDVEITRFLLTGYRICARCGKVQEVNWSFSGPLYRILKDDDERVKILREKVKDEGKYFVIVDNKLK